MKAGAKKCAEIVRYATNGAFQSKMIQVLQEEETKKRESLALCQKGGLIW